MLGIKSVWSFRGVCDQTGFAILHDHLTLLALHEVPQGIRNVILAVVRGINLEVDHVVELQPRHDALDERRVVVPLDLRQLVIEQKHVSTGNPPSSTLLHLHFGQICLQLGLVALRHQFGVLLFGLLDTLLFQTTR